MNLPEFGISPSPEAVTRSAKPSTTMKAYDALAGSAMLRRGGKSAGSEPLRGDQASTLLASRRRSDADETLDQKLKDFYQKLLRQPLPERYAALIRSLEAGRAG